MSYESKLFDIFQSRSANRSYDKNKDFNKKFGSKNKIHKCVRQKPDIRSSIDFPISHSKSILFSGSLSSQKTLPLERKRELSCLVQPRNRIKCCNSVTEFPKNKITSAINTSVISSSNQKTKTQAEKIKNIRVNLSQKKKIISEDASKLAYEENRNSLRKENHDGKSDVEISSICDEGQRVSETYDTSELQCSFSKNEVSACDSNQNNERVENINFDGISNDADIQKKYDQEISSIDENKSVLSHPDSSNEKSNSKFHTLRDPHKIVDFEFDKALSQCNVQKLNSTKQLEKENESNIEPAIEINIVEKNEETAEKGRRLSIPKIVSSSNNENKMIEQSVKKQLPTYDIILNFNSIIDSLKHYNKMNTRNGKLHILESRINACLAPVSVLTSMINNGGKLSNINCTEDEYICEGGDKELKIKRETDSKTAKNEKFIEKKVVNEVTKHIHPCICDLTPKQRATIESHLNVKLTTQLKFEKRLRKLQREVQRLEEEEEEKRKQIELEKELYGSEYEMIGKKRKRKKRSARRASMVSLGVKQIINWRKNPLIDVKYTKTSQLRKSNPTYCKSVVEVDRTPKNVFMREVPVILVRQNTTSELRIKFSKNLVQESKRKQELRKYPKRPEFVLNYYN